MLTGCGVLQYVDFFDCTGTPGMSPASAAEHSTVDAFLHGEACLHRSGMSLVSISNV